MESINPATGELIHRYEIYSTGGIEKIVHSVDKTWHHWRHTSFGYRSGLMKNLASLLRSQHDELGKMITLEMGKVRHESIAEIDKCARVCEYFAEKAEEFLQNEEISTEASQSFVSFQPVGTVLAIMPWNFPFWQVFRFAAPAVMAGNTALLKHAGNVSGCALAIEELFREAGFPENVFRTILVPGKMVESVIKQPAVKAVTLTGSTSAGRAVAALAGSQLKKCLMELGGSDPYLILPDADPEQAARICATSRLINSGQSCIAAKRFIVVENIYSAFMKYFVSFMDEAVYGDPFDPETTMGPLARADLRGELHQQVFRSVSAGAKIVTGGVIPKDRGFYYPPTVLENVGPGMPAYDEELFGPVASVIRAEDEDEGIKIANDTSFGLGAAVFTQNLVKGKYLAEIQLDAGCCVVNDFVRSDPRLPFGGIKESGFGRELSAYGIKEFTNIKSVYIR